MSLPKTTTPFLIGAAAGVIILGGLSLGNGWVVSAKAKDVEVQDAWLGAQAAVCAARATEYRKQTNSTVDLEGYQSDARKARDELAQTYATALLGQDKPASLVIAECSGLLNKPL